MNILRITLGPVTNSSSFSSAIIRGVTRQRLADLVLAQLGLWPAVAATPAGEDTEWVLTLQGDSETEEPLPALESLLKCLAAEYGFGVEFR